MNVSRIGALAAGLLAVAASPATARDGEMIVQGCAAVAARGSEAEGGPRSMLVDDLARAFEAAGAADVLLLSGGGSRGAWGAGVLEGWRRATTEPSRPQFALVTGISTGAVQATSAFLGTPDDDASLVYGYTETRNRDVYGFPYPVISYPRNLNALRKTLAKERYLPDAVIDRVGDQPTGRKLLVGTVELESGDFYVWDMTCIAKNRDYRLYREVILASCANPGGMRPIELGGKPHVDGGVRHRLFTAHVADLVSRAAARVSQVTRRRVFYVINGKLHISPEKVRSWLVPSVVGRGLDIALKQGAFSSVDTAWVDLNGKKIEWEFFGSWIPDDPEHEALDLPKSAEYETEKMKALLAAGRCWGRGNRWLRELPKSPRIDEVCSERRAGD